MADGDIGPDLAIAPDRDPRTDDGTRADPAALADLGRCSHRYICAKRHILADVRLGRYCRAALRPYRLGMQWIEQGCGSGKCVRDRRRFQQGHALWRVGPLYLLCHKTGARAAGCEGVAKGKIAREESQVPAV